MRLQLSHFQAKEADAPPSPKYVIPSFRKPPPSKEEPAIISPPSLVRESWTSHEPPPRPITISLFLGGSVVWTFEASNTKFWESESRPTRIPCEGLHFAEENKEEATEPKEEDPILLSEELPSFVEEEQEDKKFVSPLEEQVMAFEPLPVKGDLLLEEECANLHEVASQPMHVFSTVIEEINGEDNLLDELYALFSSIDVESVSPIYEEHVP